MAWKLDESLNLTGAVVLVTGCTSGLGLEAAKTFIRHGAHLVMACRNAEKMANTVDEIIEDNATITQMVLDTSDLESVRAFADDFKTKNISKIDILLLNAGIVGGELQKSRQGYELVFATNHLGHWLLTGLLLPYLKAAPSSRVVVVSSGANMFVEEINYEIAAGKDDSKFQPMQTYPESKLANVMFTTHLNRLLVGKTSKIIAVGCNPGPTVTGLIDTSKDLPIIQRMMVKIIMLTANSVQKGVQPLLMACLDDKITADSYYGPGRMELWGQPKRNCKKSLVLNDEAACEKLWEFSEELTGFKYKF